jgi:hypothetical protein
MARGVLQSIPGFWRTIRRIAALIALFALLALSSPPGSSSTLPTGTAAAGLSRASDSDSGNPAHQQALGHDYARAKPDSPPRFVPGDQNWDNRFGLPGTSDLDSPYGDTIGSVVFIEDDVYVGGWFIGAGGVYAPFIARWNTSVEQWFTFGNLISGSPTNRVNASVMKVRNNDIYVAGHFSSAGGVSASNIARWDTVANQWYPLGGGLSGGVGYTQVMAMAFDGDDIYVGGNFTTAGGIVVNGIARWNSSTGQWYSLGGGVNGTVQAIAISGDYVYVGGQYDVNEGLCSSLCRWDRVTSQWHPLGTGLEEEGTVNAFAADGDDIYVGGNFTTAGGIVVNGIARWNSSTGQWHRLSNGLGGDYPETWALELVGDNLYVGGSFADAGGVSAPGIARWNTQSGQWFALGDGLIGSALAIAANGSDIYVAGSLSSAGGLSVYNIARWNSASSTWHHLGNGVGPDDGSRSVRAVASSGTSVFVGGNFSTAGPVSANGLARWDSVGQQWHDVGGGVEGTIYSIAVSGNNVYVGGYFTAAGGTAASSIAAWNTLTGQWHDVGGGVEGTIYSIAVSGNNVYVGGYFTVAGGIQNLARWDSVGQQWHDVGGGITGVVYSIAVSGNDVYVGGYFTAAGGTAASSIAAWNTLTGQWSGLGGGILNGSGPGTVNTLSAAGAEIFVGGLFSSAGGVNMTGVARWNILQHQWYAVSGSPLVEVFAIALRDNNVYFGGDRHLGDAIAVWNRTSEEWSTLGSGLGGDILYGDPIVYGIALLGSNLYVGGRFVTAGGKPSSHFGMWHEPSQPPPTVTPSPTPTCPQNVQVPTINGDDTFSVNLYTTCNVTTNLKIGRYYGPITANGHVETSALGETVASQAQLMIEAFDVDETITVRFPGLPLGSYIVPRRPGWRINVVNVDTRQLFLPNRGTASSTPVPSSNELSITHGGGPGGHRGRIGRVVLELAGMRPLVLAAGFNFAPEPEHTQEPTLGYWNQGLWDPSGPIGQFTFHPSRDGHDSVGGGGRTLQTQIEEYKTTIGAQKVNILGHSMGGIWAREYVRNVDTGHSVDRIIMLGTPNEGSFWADAALGVYQTCLLSPLIPPCFVIIHEYEARTPAVRHLASDFMLDYNRKNKAAPCTYYYDMAGETDVGLYNWSHDGAVTTGSVQALAYSTHLVPVALPLFDGLVHLLEPQRQEFHDALKPYYSFAGNVYQEYNESCKASARQLLSATPLALTPTPEVPTLWPAVVSQIGGGETQTQTVAVDNASAVTFGLGWFNHPTSTLSLTLRDPVGQIITATSSYSGGLYLPSVDGASYSINSPIPGAWQLIVQGQSVPGGAEPYYVSGGFTGGVQVDPQLSSRTVSAGQPVTLTSMLHDSAAIAQAVVTASISLLTDGSYLDTLALTEQPGGIYHAVFTPTVRGTYGISVYASGTNSDGQTFHRLSLLQLQATSGAHLTNVFNEQAYDSGNAVFDSLVISATAVITEPGQYRLSGYLTTTGGQEIANSTGLYTPAMGTVELPLTFSGPDIGAAAVDGPYQVRDLYLSQIISEELPVAHLPLAYTTAAYSRYDWVRGNIVQSGLATDQGIDGDSNGKYEYLQVSIPIDVRAGGIYGASLNLIASDGSPVASAVTQSLTLLQGANTLVMRFDGSDILASGVNGPYRVEDLAVWTSTPGEEPANIASVLAQTQAYAGVDFEGKVLVGHVAWEGRGPQPGALQQLPVDFTMKIGSTEIDFPARTTNAGGYFTVSVASLLNGTYEWRVKGAQHLANADNVSLAGASSTSIEMGLMRAGDANNDNTVDVLDFNILKGTFGLSLSNPGYDASADFTGDNVVDVLDFNLLKGNFGQSGPGPLRPGGP